MDPRATSDDAARPLDVARRLYAAFEQADVHALMALLAPSFRATVTAGLPRGWGGCYDGPAAMLSECWRPVFEAFDARPVPDSYLEVVDGRVVVLGYYRGRARADARPLDAAFAHVLACDGAQITELVQITDSARWAHALGACAHVPHNDAA